MASETDHSPSRDAVSRVLRNHGLSGVAIARLWQLSRSMRRDSRRRGIEYAAMVDASTGETVGSVITGRPHSGDLLPHLLALISGHRYVQIHTHPGSSSFSDLDIALLLSWEKIQTMVVIGVDGTWCVLSQVRSPRVAPVDAAEAFLTELDRIGAEDPDCPLQEQTHMVWLHIAQNLGMQYDRVQKEEP